MISKVKLIFLLVAGVLMVGCNANTLRVDEVEATYINDGTSSIIVNVCAYVNADENDTLFFTISSPDGMLTFDGTAVKVIEGGKVYYTIGDLILPYKISGEWDLKVARSDKDTHQKFFLNAPSDDIEYPSFLKETRLLRVNGNVYTVVSPSLEKEQSIEISAFDNVKKESKRILRLETNKEASAVIDFKTSMLVYTTPYQTDGLIFRKTEIL